ncbi:protein of unknown function [Streptomyces murinus]
MSDLKAPGVAVSRVPAVTPRLGPWPGPAGRRSPSPSRSSPNHAIRLGKLHKFERVAKSRSHSLNE